ASPTRPPFPPFIGLAIPVWVDQLPFRAALPTMTSAIARLRRLQQSGQKAPGFKRGLKGPPAVPRSLAGARRPARTSCTVPTTLVGGGVPPDASPLGTPTTARWTRCAAGAPARLF